MEVVATLKLKVAALTLTLMWQLHLLGLGFKFNYKKGPNSLLGPLCSYSLSHLQITFCSLPPSSVLVSLGLNS
jgi:hypothetical protein